MTHNNQYRHYALEFLAYYVRCGYGSLAKICSDYRAGSVGKGVDLYCEMGGLYSTTEANPAKNILVKSLRDNRTLASFPVAEIYTELGRHPHLQQ